MSLRAYFPTEFACGDVFERKESEVAVIDESESSCSWELRNYKGGTASMDFHHHANTNANGNGNAIEFDMIDFWPVEHPMEPQDEDRPVKCPMPASSSINIDRKLVVESQWKRSERPETVKKGIAVATETEKEAPVRAVRKRHHHSLTRDDHLNTMKPLVGVPRPPHNLTIFQMLQEFDKSNS